ncbi:hypothetical protein PROVRETT_05948 [Providencia rettgeri DSM 1131]|nr:hypothetical protein PROVRETT_05948 [Providencia rettgeri DSM 1131]
MISLLGLAFSSYSETEGAVGVGQDTLTLTATGIANISISARSDILEGEYRGGFVLANWQAEVTEGTLAFRLNPSIVEQYSTPTYLDGVIWNLGRTQFIEIQMTHNCSSTTLSGMWQVCPTGIAQASGSLVTQLGKLQTLRSGTYPVAVDAVVWTF